MKKTLFLAAAASALFAFAGCTKDAIEPIIPNTPGSKLATISASTAPQEDETRTSLSDGDILWTEGDQIAIRPVSQYKTLATYTLKTGAGTTKGTFEGEALPEEAKYAFYPRSKYSSSQYAPSTIDFELSTTQPYKAGSFGNGANPMVAKCDAALKNLAFQNLCGAIRLKITGTASVKQIVVTSAGESIAAGVSRINMAYKDVPQFQMTSGNTAIVLTDINETLDPVTPTEFTIILPPGVYAAGMNFRIETSDGQFMNKVTTTPITIARSKVLPLTAFEVVVKTHNFPDKNFRAFLKEQGCVLSNEGTADEDIDINNATNKGKFASITEIDCSSKSIISLKGIEYFTALKILNCNNSPLTSLDLSANTALTSLKCYDNSQLTALDLSANTALETLQCNNTPLTSLKLPAGTALKTLQCDNNKLTELDLSESTALLDLQCSKNKLTSLDLTANTTLIYLNCFNNQLTSLDLSENTALRSFDCNNNRLTSLDLPATTTLTYLNCFYNQLTSLDLSAVTALQDLNCSNNQLTELNLTANTALTNLTCTANQLTLLNLTKTTALIYIACNSNQFTSLDLSENTALQNLQCDNNKLTELNLTANTALTRLNCATNQLTLLDLTKNTALQNLQCSNNQLTELNLTANTKLTNLNCFANRLTSLNLTYNTFNIKGLQIGAQVAADGTLLDMTAYVSENQTSALDTSRKENARATLVKGNPPTPAPAMR